MKTTQLPAAIRYFPWFVLILSAITVFKVLNERPFGLRVQFSESGKMERLAIQDFASHLVFSKEVWSSGVRYDVKTHLNIVQKWGGADIKVALPFGYSPTMSVVLYPLTLLTPDAAYFAWSCLGILASAWLFRHIGVAGSLAWISPLAISGWVLGQTAFLSMAAFLAISLVIRKRAEGNCPPLRADILVGILLCALTAKPPIGLAAFAAVAATRNWRALAFGMSVTAVVLLTASARFGGTIWVYDYLEMIRDYNVTKADPAYAWSLHPETMTNLRALLTVLCKVPDDISAKASSFAWIGTSVGILLWSLLQRQTISWAFSTSLLAYLLFCPHLTSTEDLHLVLLFAFSLWLYPLDNFAGRRAGFLNSDWIRALALLLIFLHPGPTKQAIFIAFGFAGKLALLVVWAWCAAATKTNHT